MRDVYLEFRLAWAAKMGRRNVDTREKVAIWNLSYHHMD
jgi:hypothetical protein